MRKAASLALMLAVLAWANAVLAIPAYSQVSQCRRQQPHASAMSAMPCCPKHVQSDSAHAPRTIALTPVNLHRSNCCTISSQREGPTAFLVVPQRHFSSEFRPSTARAYLPPVPRATDLKTATSPPITIAVFDKKTDLRI
jgi:hypothetical protein